MNAQQYYRKVEVGKFFESIKPSTHNLCGIGKVIFIVGEGLILGLPSVSITTKLYWF